LGAAPSPQPLLQTLDPSGTPLLAVAQRRLLSAAIRPWLTLRARAASSAQLEAALRGNVQTIGRLVAAAAGEAQAVAADEGQMLGPAAPVHPHAER
jgi:hypothetical protein